MAGSIAHPADRRQTPVCRIFVAVFMSNADNHTPDNSPENATQKPADSSLGQSLKNWFSKKTDAESSSQNTAPHTVQNNSENFSEHAVENNAEKKDEDTIAENADSFLARMKVGLSRTRSSFSSGLTTLLIGGKEIDDELLEDIETQMLVADVGIDATRRIIDALTARVARNELTHSNALYKALQKELAELLTPHVAPLIIDTSKKPFVILMVGINGVGKTTTIGKLAKKFQNEGKSVMLAAGDTFRAAAVEQLTVWGERNNVPVIAQANNADSASVIFDAISSARAKNIDVLIADTAGRLHTKTHLMEELKKVLRVIKKVDASAPHEIMLVVDAGTGQNALSQVHEFHQAVGLTGLTVTKLDGTAKGGVIFNIASRSQVPIRFIGVGEKIDDLRPFEPSEFVAALFEAE